MKYVVDQAKVALNSIGEHGQVRTKLDDRLKNLYVPINNN